MRLTTPGGALPVRIALAVLAVLAAFVLLSGPSVVAHHTLEGELGGAQVEVTVDSDSTVLRGLDEVELRVHVQGGLVCDEGPPASLVGTIIPEESHSGLELVFEPRQVRVDWTQRETEDPDANETAYYVNETVLVTARVVEPPIQRVVTSVLVIFQPDPASERGCTERGYSVMQTEQPQEPLVVEPDGARDQGERQAPAVNWFPLIVAVALLVLITVFALQRQKRRG